MIRTAAIPLLLACPAVAETPLDVRVANDLRACIQGSDGFRDATRLGQLDLSLAQVPNRFWTGKTEIAPGIFRLTSDLSPVTIEIKLPDATGAAYCMAFGPALAVGQGAHAADKFVELNFLDGLAPAEPAPGTTRRYVVTGAAYTAELIAYPAEGLGDIVGFSFAGVPQDLETRSLSQGDPAVSAQAATDAVSGGVEICLRNFFSPETVEAAAAAAGFAFGHSGGGSTQAKTYFTADNAVSLRIAPGGCEVATHYMNPTAAHDIASSRLNAAAPGGFVPHVNNASGCRAFHAAASLGLPLGLEIHNIRRPGQDARPTCIEDGTSRITFTVAG